MEKRGLGRGLSALIPESTQSDRGGEVREIPLEQIVANPYQPRTLFDPIKMEELVASVKEHGILQPVLLRRIGHERYQLVAGERRFRAAQGAGLAGVPALVRDISEKESLEIAIVENVQREDIGAIEAARAYRRMVDEFAMTQETIAVRVGKSRSGIANTLRLLDLPEEVQDSVERGEVSEGHGRALLAAGSVENIRRAWQAVVKRGLSVRDTEKLAREFRNLVTSVASGAGYPGAANGNGANVVGQSGNTRSGSADPNEMAAADALQQRLGTKVTIRRGGGTAGKIEIEFYSSEELERLVDLLTNR